MADPFSKGQQPVQRHGHSHLRNEFYADSADDETVQVPNSDTFVPETQSQHHGDLAVADREHDKQSDYGNDDGLDDAALLQRTSVMNTIEFAAPSSPTWTMLSRESLRRHHDASPSPSPHFTFGQPTRAANPSTPHKPSLESSQASSNSPPHAAKGPGSHAQDGHHTVAHTPVHRLDGEPWGMQHDDSHAQFLPARTRAGNGDHKMRPANHALGTEEKGTHLLGKQSTAPPSAQPTGLLSQRTRKMRTTKKGRKSRSGLPAQQHVGPWPPRGNVSSNPSYQMEKPAIPNVIMECVVPDPLQNGPAQLSTGETNLQQVLQIREVDIQHDQASRDSTPCALQSIDLQSKAPVSPADFTIVSQQTSTEDLPPCIADEIDRTKLATQDLFNADPLDLSPHEQSLRSNSATGDSRFSLDDCLVEMSQQPAHKSSTEQKTAPLYNPQRSTNEAILHETSTKAGPRRISKPQKKSRVPSGTFTHRPQISAVPSTIDSHLDALRVSLLADQFRKEHEQLTSTKHHEELVAALNGRINLQDEMIVDLKDRHEQLGSGVTRLTEKAKTNQKYVTALYKDYEKLQKSVTVFQAQNKMTLREKIAEVESERDALRKDFGSTLDSFDTIKKNMKATIDDLCVRFQISESKRASQVESLSKHTAMLQEERTKRDALEKSLVASVQTIQQQLGENTSTLITKLETLQCRAAAATAVENHEFNIKECLVAIRDLQSTPFLNMQDVQKAEGMLRFVHERLETGFDSMTASGKTKDLITEEMQEFIKAQMQTLQREILKYDEVVADNRKTVEANAILRTQLAAEQQHCGRLDAQLKVLQQAEGDIKGRSIQLECELRDLKNAARKKDLHPLITEQELSNLHHRLKQASVDLISANEKTQQSERLRQELEKTSSEHETKYNDLVEHLRKMDAALKQKPKTEDITEMRGKIVDACKKEFREKESGYKNQVHRLTLERDEKEQLRRKLHNELNASKAQLHGLRKDHQALNMKLDALRHEHEGAKVELGDLRRAASTSSASGPTLATLTDQLRQKTEELQSKTRDHALVQQQYAESANVISKLQASHDQLQTQVSAHSSAIETHRREAEDHLIESQKRAKIAVEVCRAEISRLQMEKQEVVSELELTRSRERDLEKHDAELILERDDLQRQLDDLQRQLAERCASNAEKDAETLQLKTNAGKEKQLLVNKHRTELEAWTCRQAQNDAALREAETILRRKDDECQAKIKYEREKAEGELSRIVDQYESFLQSKEKQDSSHQPTSSSLGHDGTPTHPKLILHVGPSRKKVSRQNNSTLNVTSPFVEQHGRIITVVRTEKFDLHRESSDHSDNLFEERTVTRAPSSQTDLSQVNPAPDVIPEIQGMQGPTMSIDDFRESLSQASRRELESENASSPDLSPMNSDALSHLGRDVEQQCGSSHAKHGHEDGKHGKETSTRSDNISECGSRSSYSQERPKSQANTASRLMPPTVTMSKHFAVRQPAEDDRTTFSHVRRKNDQASSPEYMPPPSHPVKKQTYAHRQPIQTRRDVDSPDPLQEPGLGHGQKRKGLAIHDGTGTKKPRSSPQFTAEEESSQLKNRSSYSSKPSIEASRSRKQPDSAQTSINSSTVSRSQARNASSSVAPRTPTQNASSSGTHHSRGQQLPSSSARDKAPSRRSARNKSRVHDMFDQRFNRELS